MSPSHNELIDKRAYADGTVSDKRRHHYNGVIMGAIASRITSLTSVYSIRFYSEADQRKHQSSATLAFVRGIHRGPVNSPHKWSVTRKMFPFDDIIKIHKQVRCTYCFLPVYNSFSSVGSDCQPFDFIKSFRFYVMCFLLFLMQTCRLRNPITVTGIRSS